MSHERTEGGKRDWSTPAAASPLSDLALLHLGGTRVLGIMVMHANEGVEMMHIVNPQMSIPIHYDDYEVFKLPLSDFQKAVREAGVEHRVHYLGHGESYNFHIT